MTAYTIASWNIQAIRGASDERLAAIADALAAHAPDVVALQEVSSRGATFERLSAHLTRAGLPFAHFSGHGAADHIRRDRRKRYGNVIASRWPLAPVARPVEAPWPQLIAAADVEVPGHAVRVVSVHAPNAAGNGWDKVRTLEALHEGLLAVPGPCIVVGDFNEPRTFVPTLQSFRALPDGTVTGDWTDRFGETDSRARWQAAVESLLGDDAAVAQARWPGRPATRQAGVEPEPTHVVRGGAARCFDHTLVSPPVRALSVRYDHDVRTGDAPLSDHSLVVAEIALPDVHSRRTDRVGAVDTPYGRIVWVDGPLTDGTRIQLDRAGECPPRELLHGSLIAHTNGAVLEYLP
ncbi:endonuclease/exonuclease/phosphatase family protein [Demequina pelophila]|uniref:endonuclease/exonuclease/phosphatase family protein n=1 Tax=Demequina pelophila TaxID=1638984 RepID=UPI000782B9D8|nr:endonuclease/exonuclease/phosphatase family protein [Demequina pelophila]